MRPERLRLIGVLALALLGAAGLVVSFVLSPTPDTFMVMSNGHRVRTPASMHAVDYAIFILRIGGAVAVLVGAYLAYRAWRPDRIDAHDGVREQPRDAYSNIPPHAGVHVPGGGVDQGGAH
ncbi:MAG TPA: hypothetical protein VLB81_15235 [Gaiellales bacterium]|nr:hypothetical protein [Gaiellales bacterium]